MILNGEERTFALNSLMNEGNCLQGEVLLGRVLHLVTMKRSRTKGGQSPIRPLEISTRSADMHWMSFIGVPVSILYTTQIGQKLFLQEDRKWFNFTNH